MALSKLPDHMQKTIVRAYAFRTSAKELHLESGVSRNTIYRFYGLIRVRLIACRYYSDFPDFPKSEKSEYQKIEESIRGRRGIREDNFPLHASELMTWHNRSTPALVLKHIYQIVRLTGPINREPQLSADEYELLKIYVKLTQIEIVVDRMVSRSHHSQLDREKLEEAKNAAANLRKSYLAARKRMWRKRI